MHQWENQVAFITGGAQGIGLGIARALGSRGVRLALADVDAPALERAARELPARTFVLDVRDREAFARAADETEAELGPVSLLFNNAGIAPFASAGELSYEKWDLALGVNVTGVVNGVQTFLPRLIERGRGGYIVNTASGAGLVPGPNVLYVTTKFAVVGLSESLRQSVAGHGIDVSVLCPGPVDTAIMSHTEQWADGLRLGDDARERTESFLRSGANIDEVGEMVVAGMQARATWIHTGTEVRAYIEQRNEALMASLPA